MRAEFRALLAHDAEPMPRRRLHDPPALDERDARCAERFEAHHFRFDVVGFDVQMYTRFVRDALQQQERLVGVGFQFGVLAVAILIRIRNGTTQRLAPELRCRDQITAPVSAADMGVLPLGVAAFIRLAKAARWLMLDSGPSITCGSEQAVASQVTQSQP